MSASATPSDRVWEHRRVVSGPGALAAALPLLGRGFTLLTTPRTAALAPAVAARAGHVLMVPPGLVEDLAGALLNEVEGDRLVALGGGRVIDTAKSLAAARPGTRLAALPTTLSGAEMSRIHRIATGLPATTAKARPGLVINDPAMAASAPVAALAASSANALGHALVAGCADRATADLRELARTAVATFAAGWRDPANPDRPALATGALLSGRALDRTGLGLHHVGAQTMVRTLGLPHAEANARMLPESIGALRRRAPRQLATLSAAADGSLSELAATLRRVGATTAVPADRRLEELVAAALARPQAATSAPAPDGPEWRTLFTAALAPSVVT